MIIRGLSACQLTAIQSYNLSGALIHTLIVRKRLKWTCTCSDTVLAEERDSRKYPDDRERPLTGKGIKRLTRQVRGMNSMRIRPDVILTSPLRRAVQTAEVVLEGLSNRPEMEFSDSLVPWADPQEILDELRLSHAAERSVMVVGHEPHVSSLISLVSSGTLDCAIRMKKGALCKLRIPSPGSRPLRTYRVVSDTEADDETGMNYWCFHH